MKPAPRSRAQRKADTLALLRTEVDRWVASADEMENAHLVPLSQYRDGATLVLATTELGLEVRAGIHTGDCELVGEKLAGISVVTGSRISSLAAPGEVLVSSTVKELVAGSGFSFEDRGEHALKGVPGTWRLYAAAE